MMNSQNKFSFLTNNVAAERDSDFSKHNEVEPTSIQTNNNVVAPSRHYMLLSKVIRFELEQLEVSKTYVGFNYLVNLLSNELALNTNHESSAYFSQSENLNRDIRHMLQKCWQTNAKFKSSLSRFISPRCGPCPPKLLLNALIEYLHTKF